MSKNPLKWPETEQLGREFYEHIKPALDQLAGGASKLDDKELEGITKLQAWLDAPCVATVKLDGTNVGVDNAGLMVGRNVVIEPGQNYQKVDVWTQLAEYPDKAEQLRRKLVQDAGNEPIAQAMLYGELVVNGKYDYTASGIFKSWLCFGAVLRPTSDEDDASLRLCQQLRKAGYNAQDCEGKVLLTPNHLLSDLLDELGIHTVAASYVPQDLDNVQWKAHDGRGSLPYFTSLRKLLASDWAQSFFSPSKGAMTGEGLVVASEADGRLFKWKHGGEELGKVPEQLEQAVARLKEIDQSDHASKLLPHGLLQVFEKLLQVATTKPSSLEKHTDSKKRQKEKEFDTEALAVWESALTKYDALEEVFGRSTEARTAREAELIEQVRKDLIKDYGACEKLARQRAAKVVKVEIGKSFGLWKKTNTAGA
jgi:hypothetical protein